MWVPLFLYAVALLSGIALLVDERRKETQRLVLMNRRAIDALKSPDRE